MRLADLNAALNSAFKSGLTPYNLVVRRNGFVGHAYGLFMLAKDGKTQTPIDGYDNLASALYGALEILLGDKVVYHQREVGGV